MVLVIYTFLELLVQCNAIYLAIKQEADSISTVALFATFL